MEKLLPHNIDAEMGVLGSIIIDPEAIVQVVDFLSPDDFYRDAHKSIYRVMHTLNDRHEMCDFITLCDELERRQKLEEAGGASYIGSLINNVPTSGNVEYYARIVERTAILRRLIHAAGQIAAAAYEEGDADRAVRKAEELVYQISQGRKQTSVSSLAEVMGRYMNKLDIIHEKRLRGVVSGVPTGFTLLDGILGGLQPSDLITLAARPSVGKTSLALNIAHHVMANAGGQGYRVLLFSLEMSEEQLARRLLSMTTGIDQVKLRTGWISDDPVYHEGQTYESEWDLITSKIGTLTEGTLWIDDTPGLALMDMRARAWRAQIEHGLDLVIVDYMQLMQAFMENGRIHENRVQEVSAISRGLKGLARELNVPVLALAQLSRAVEQRADGIPQLSDLRESGSIEQDSDIVMFIHQAKDVVIKEHGYPLNIIVAKHRNGPTGVVPLWFQHHLTLFVDMEARHD